MTAQHTPGLWAQWAGGECPVRGETVDVRKRDNSLSLHLPAERLNWAHSTGALAGYASDIIAYRVVSA